MCRLIGFVAVFAGIFWADLSWAQLADLSPPKKPFDQMKPPPPPDYAQESA